MKLVPLDKYGWPVERFRNRPIINAIRLLLHTRRVVTRAEWERREAARQEIPILPGQMPGAPIGVDADAFDRRR